ncbi:MAG: methyltransferase domain-containing protein, partial [Candidatus Omnitrophota bacterium]
MKKIISIVLIITFAWNQIAYATGEPYLPAGKDFSSLRPAASGVSSPAEGIIETLRGKVYYASPAYLPHALERINEFLSRPSLPKNIQKQAEQLRSEIEQRIASGPEVAYRIIFSKQAEKEVKKLRKSHSPFVEGLKKKCDLIAQYPMKGKIFHQTDCRIERFGKLAIIYYADEENKTVYILVVCRSEDIKRKREITKTIEDAIEQLKIVRHKPEEKISTQYESLDLEGYGIKNPEAKRLIDSIVSIEGVSLKKKAGRIFFIFYSSINRMKEQVGKIKGFSFEEDTERPGKFDLFDLIRTPGRKVKIAKIGEEDEMIALGPNNLNNIESLEIIKKFIKRVIITPRSAKSKHLSGLILPISASSGKIVPDAISNVNLAGIGIGLKIVLALAIFEILLRIATWIGLKIRSRSKPFKEKNEKEEQDFYSSLYESNTYTAKHHSTAFSRYGKRALNVFKEHFVTEKKKRKKVLSIGCGPCDPYGIEYWAKKLKHEVWGVDINREGIAAARARGINTFVGGAESLPEEITGQRYDIVLFSLVLGHIEESKLTHVLEEASRVLKDDGVLLIFDLGASTNPYSPRSYRIYGLEKLGSSLENAGFTVYRKRALRFFLKIPFLRFGIPISLPLKMAFLASYVTIEAGKRSSKSYPDVFPQNPLQLPPDSIAPIKRNLLKLKEELAFKIMESLGARKLYMATAGYQLRQWPNLHVSTAKRVYTDLPKKMGCALEYNEKLSKDMRLFWVKPLNISKRRDRKVWMLLAFGLSAAITSLAFTGPLTMAGVLVVLASMLKDRGESLPGDFRQNEKKKLATKCILDKMHLSLPEGDVLFGNIFKINDISKKGNFLTCIILPILAWMGIGAGLEEILPTAISNANLAGIVDIGLMGIVGGLVVGLVWNRMKPKLEQRISSINLDTSIEEGPKDDLNGEDLIFGFASTNPLKHNPQGPWAYFTHTGICEQKNYTILLSLYEDLSKAREKLFCCFKSSHRFPITWKPIGFILDISRGGELLYADNLRDLGDTIYPLQLYGKELKELKETLRKQKRIDTSPSDKVKEMEVTNADVIGICLNLFKVDPHTSTLSKGLTIENDRWLYEWLDFVRMNQFTWGNFCLLMAMAIKYNLPIVFIHEEMTLKEYIAIRQEFEEYLDRKEEDMLAYLKSIYIDLDGIDFKNAILRQIRPKLNSNLSQIGPGAQWVYEDAVKLLEAGNYDRTIEECIRLITEHGSSDEVRKMITEVFQQIVTNEPERTSQIAAALAGLALLEEGVTPSLKAIQKRLASLGIKGKIDKRFAVIYQHARNINPNFDPKLLYKAYVEVQEKFEIEERRTYSKDKTFRCFGLESNSGRSYTHAQQNEWIKGYGPVGIRRIEETPFIQFLRDYLKIEEAYIQKEVRFEREWMYYGSYLFVPKEYEYFVELYLLVEYKRMQEILFPDSPSIEEEVVRGVRILGKEDAFSDIGAKEKSFILFEELGLPYSPGIVISEDLVKTIVIEASLLHRYH